ncbi:MAG TPA: endolytic transglycosylase MltG [Patescibacteria group bacterium]|nr:endolytic transglycosylase MltG [Patescibacteria group bacterium]
MTIRSGGRVRDRNQARPAEPGTYEDAWQPEYAVESPGRGRGSGGGYSGGGNDWNHKRRGGIPGFIKFLLFAIVLGGIVVTLLVTALRPLVRDAIVGWASDNPAALDMPFVADLVREDIGERLTKPASADTTQVAFVVNDGESARTIANRLEENGFLLDGRAFVVIATEKDLTKQLASGSFILRKSMTPNEIVDALLNPEQIHYVEIALRTGLRLEQVTAKLETIGDLAMNAEDFYELAKHPTASLLADYPTVRDVLPKGASLEGFLWPATYRVLPDTTAEELIRDMLGGFEAAVGDRLDVPAARGLSSYEVLTLASLVEREAVLDVDRPLIAGVFQNRMNPKLFGNLHLGSDPTIFWINDTIQLAKIDVAEWVNYTFWTTLKEQLPADLPGELAGYNTYLSQGLTPGPICTPTLKSIDAALNPDTSDKYLYFLAKADGSGETVYAKTAKEHQANIAKYGKP